MAEAKVVKTVAAPAQKVFEILGAFDQMKPGGAIDNVTYEGEGVGMLRHISMGGGVVTERLNVHDTESLTMSYAIINEDSPLPFDDYSSVVQVNDNGDNTCTVEWVGTFKPRGDEETAIKTATGIYAGGIKGAKIALGVD